ncbi:hypothetical protein MRX96_005904 [Rhipicephalus microplus]
MDTPGRLFGAMEHRMLPGGKVDILPSRTNLDDKIVDIFSFADTDLHHDTFYARANDTRSVSVFAVLSHSTWGLTLTLLSMLTCTLVLTLLNCTDTFRTFLAECSAGDYISDGITPGHLDTRT